MVWTSTDHDALLSLANAVLENRNIDCTQNILKLKEMALPEIIYSPSNSSSTSSSTSSSPVVATGKASSSFTKQQPEDHNKESSSSSGSSSISVALNSTGSEKGDALFVKLKPHQQEQWMAKFKELALFHMDHGHSTVPINYNKNRVLALWVHDQRKQYKLYKAGKPSRLSKERLALMDSINFVWEMHEHKWSLNFDTLLEFRNEHGHCNVPITYNDRKLALWVKRLRREYKQFFSGRASYLTPERILELEKIGFRWNLIGKAKV